MKYTITQANSMREQYVNDHSQHVVHTWHDTYETGNVETCKSILRDLLDAPLAEFTLDEIKKHFSDDDNVISEREAIRIQNYYNGRYALYVKLLKDIDNIDVNESAYFSYDIPPDYNSFNDDPMIEQQLKSTIELKFDENEEGNS